MSSRQSSLKRIISQVRTDADDDSDRESILEGPLLGREDPRSDDGGSRSPSPPRRGSSHYRPLDRHSPPRSGRESPMSSASAMSRGSRRKLEPLKGSPSRPLPEVNRTPSRQFSLRGTLSAVRSSPAPTGGYRDTEDIESPGLRGSSSRHRLLGSDGGVGGVRSGDGSPVDDEAIQKEVEMRHRSRFDLKHVMNEVKKQGADTEEKEKQEVAEIKKRKQKDELERQLKKEDRDTFYQETTMGGCLRCVGDVARNVVQLFSRCCEGCHFVSREQEALLQHELRKGVIIPAHLREIDPEILKEALKSFAPNSVLSVNISHTDMLTPDILVLHPMVKMHVVDMVTGQHMLKSKRGRPTVYPTNERMPEGIDEVILPQTTRPCNLRKIGAFHPMWKEVSSSFFVLFCFCFSLFFSSLSSVCVSLCVSFNLSRSLSHTSLFPLSLTPPYHLSPYNPSPSPFLSLSFSFPFSLLLFLSPPSLYLHHPTPTRNYL